MWTLNAFLTDESPVMTNESLAEELKDYFSNHSNFSLTFEKLPFAPVKTLALWWDKWRVRVAYEEMPRVLEEAVQIKKTLGDAAPDGLLNAPRKVRVVFGDDPDNVYTNETVEMMTFLQSIKGSIVFDPQQNEFLDPIE